MPKPNRYTALLAAISLIFIVFIGCRKEESGNLSSKEEEQASMATAVSETETEFAFNDVFDNVVGVNGELGIAGTGIFGKIIRNGKVLNVDSARCFQVSVTPLQLGVFPKTVVIDFGNGCTVQGHTRYGKIKTVYTGRLILPGSSATTTFDNYRIDSTKVEGTHKITNTTSAGTLQKTFQVDVTDAKLSMPSGNYIIWESHRTEKQVEGNGTEFNQDDIFTITGSSKGKVKKNDYIYSWNAEIIEPLMKRFTCHWISKGILKVRRETLPAGSPWVSTLDYGAGQCDNKALLTINSTGHQITLR